MEILLSPPFTGRLLCWEPRAGQRSATLCVKATFALADGREAVPAAQQDGMHDDVHWDYNPHASLWAPGDHVPRKARVDILLVGHAYAPAGGLVESVVARLCVDDLDKSLRVTGDRVWTPTPEGPRPSAPQPFQRMPLRYERAPRAGDNVIGIPEGRRPEAGAPLPNVEIADARSPEATPGFGPIAPRWRAQSRRLPDAWIDWADRVRTAAGPPPPGFDFGLFNAAPRDQQIDALRPGAVIVLEHLHPTHAQLRSWLPPIRPKAVRIGVAAGPASEVDLTCDTLWIDADRELAVVSWRGVVPDVADERAPGKIAVVTEAAQAGRTSGASSGKGRGAFLDFAKGTMAISDGPSGEAPLPFAPGPAPAEIASPQPQRRRAPAFATGTIEVPPAAEGPALPFGPEPAPPRAERPSSAPAPFLAFAKQTMAAPESIPGNAPLPFAPGPAPAAIASPERPRTRPPAFATETIELPPFVAERPSLPFEPAPVPASVPLPASVPPPPPPPPAPISTEPSPEDPPRPAAPPAPALEAPPPRPPEATPIEETAAMQASIDLKRTPVATILETHGLSEAEWAAVEQHWQTAMAEEMDRRKGGLLRRFDDAYVAQIEKERGPLGAEEIAGLLSGAAPALPGVELPADGVMRVKRVAIRRVAASPALAASVRRGMAMAAEE